MKIITARRIILNIVFKNNLFTKEKYHSVSGVYGYKPYVRRREPEDFSPTDVQNRNENCTLYSLIKAYREHGHKVAKIDPLGLRKILNVPELDVSRYGLDSSKLSKKVKVNGLVSGLDINDTYTVHYIVEFLKATYTGTISAEFMHLPDLKEREWFAEQFESLQNVTLSESSKKIIATDLMKNQVFENFLQTKFSTVKRYSGEGADSMITFFSELINSAPENGISNLVIGMPHRGRLSLMTVLLQYPPVAVFQKMKGFSEFPPGSVGTGDVLSHLFTSTNLSKGLHVMLLPNPSHLEAVSPVTVGKARGRLQSLKAGDYAPIEVDWTSPVLAVQVHGDGSFAGQGIVMETLAMANLPHFTVGGSVHLIVNNQLGFTTPQHRGNSSLYCSDMIKMIGSPIFHVNGDCPEDVAKVVQLALKYRTKFNKDILIDLVCFRRYGHNELDDPTYTNPVMYSSVYSRPQTCPELYANKLILEGTWSQNNLQEVIASQTELLNNHYKEIGSYQPQPSILLGRWEGTLNPPTSITKWETGLPEDLLRYIGAKSVEIPEGFKAHPNLKRVLLTERPKKLAEGTKIDWATAETLAIGSLLYQAFNVRISGQDVGRGTFSQRHMMLVDQETDEIVIPLNNLIDNQKGFLEMCDSCEDEIDGDDRNWKVVNPTTPAQYFHLLRRQMVQNFRKPLVVIAPKILLRLPAAMSSLSEFGTKYTFSPVLSDPLLATNAEKVETVILCSGKHFYELHKEREARGRINDTAIIRLEALCPFPAGEISQELQKYKNAKKYIWSQEEHRNSGAWTFVRPRFQNLLSCKLIYAGRKELSAAAVGIGVLHQKEVKEIMDKTFSK